MERVTGIGGIFFKAQDPKKLASWYRESLGIEPDADGSVAFKWREEENTDRRGYTIWSPFPMDTSYFDPSASSFMINYRVADLDAILEQLRSQGAEVDDKIEESEYGRFGWVMDPEGNRLELWEPPVEKRSAELSF
ncbi:MAG: VOC family protein [Candidatus Krumholzibacteria bacterium]